jgi:hypothetical protein
MGTLIVVRTEEPRSMGGTPGTSPPPGFKVCAKCGKPFRTCQAIQGRVRVLARRRFCLSCSPFGQHNTRRLDSTPATARSCRHSQKPTRNAAYCSNRCQSDARWALAMRRVEASGVAPEIRLAKRYLRETRGQQCSICGGTQWQGQPMPLILDHLDGNAANWALANLRLVCPNCDAQLPTFKSRNRGKGRAWRRARYAEGKSY